MRPASFPNIDWLSRQHSLEKGIAFSVPMLRVLSAIMAALLLLAWFLPMSLEWTTVWLVAAMLAMSSALSNNNFKVAAKDAEKPTLWRNVLKTRAIALVSSFCLLVPTPAHTESDFTPPARSINRQLPSDACRNPPEAEGGDYAILCAAGEKADDKVLVHWKMSPASRQGTNDDNRSAPVWDNGTVPIPDKNRPIELEVFAGPNPASLKQVAKVVKPGLDGACSAALPGNYGLLQARWTLPDGSRKSGPLSVYVCGDNLISNSAVPAEKSRASAGGFQTGQPGPLGEKSSVKLDLLHPLPERKILLAEIPIDKVPRVIFVTGWLQADPTNGQLPQVVFLISQEDGNTVRDNVDMPQASPGQWEQFVKVFTVGTSLPDARLLAKETRKLSCFLSLRSSMNRNFQWRVRGGWDGLGVFSFNPAKPAEPAEEPVDELISHARTLASKKEYSAAAKDLVAAFRQNPKRVIDRAHSRLLETFDKAGMLSELYTLFSEPALYFPDPLADGTPAMNSGSLIEVLAKRAFQGDAPSCSAEWLRVVDAAPLDGNMRFLLDAVRLQREAACDPAKVTPERILALLGFRRESIDLDRVQNIWADSFSAMIDLLKLVDSSEKIVEAEDVLSTSPVPVSHHSARKIIEAWLLAPSDPPTALKCWSEALALRNSNQNAISWNDSKNRTMFARIAAKHGSPGEVVATMKNAESSTRLNPEQQQRRLVEDLYFLANQETTGKEFYATAWADAELDALKMPGPNPPPDRLRELVKRMSDAAEWDRLEALVAQAETNAWLSSYMQRDFSQIRNIVAAAKGDLSKAWPVAWCSPGTNSRKVKISWQWNAKNLDPLSGKIDTAVSVATMPLFAEIANQAGIEFLFGEVPWELSAIGKIDGKAASGTLEAELPSGNGFLRAVATVGDHRIPGPLVPVLTGIRIFPGEGISLRDLFMGGEKPIESNILADSGSAPDGSPALRIGAVGARETRGFDGFEYPVQPGKIYVLRAWQRRSGDGGGSLGVRWNPAKASKAHLSEETLSERGEPSAQWVLYTRVFPTLPQHTRWIPFREVGFVVPRFWNMPSGTEVAGFELLEISDWKYGKWLEEIDMLRESSGDSVDQALLDKMVDLAALEPLTAMEYHRRWLADRLAQAGHAEKLIPLYQSAMHAEPNPLFPRLERKSLFGSLHMLVDNPNIPEPVRWDALQIALANLDQMTNPLKVVFPERYLVLAKARGLDGQAKEAVANAFFAGIAEKTTGQIFLSALLSGTHWNHDHPMNDLLALMNTLADDAATKKLIAEISAENGPGIPADKKAFILLAFELCSPASVVDQSWIARIDKAFQTLEKGKSEVISMYWPALLGELMIAKKCAPDVIRHLQTTGIERVLAAKKRSSKQQEELLRATVALLDSCSADGDQNPLKEFLPRILDKLSSSKQKFSETSLRLALRLLDSLTAADDKTNADALWNLLEPDVRKSPKMLEAYSKYLPAPSPTPPAVK